MRIIRTISLLLAFSVVFVHSVFPHHHHVQPQADHIDGEDHHHDGGLHRHEQDKHPHTAFSFAQIENIFLTGKHIAVSASVSPAVIEVFEWSVTIDYRHELHEIHITDVPLPPLISTGSHFFRGPPQA